MKKKLFSFLALALCLASSMMAQTVSISNASELVAFANRVNNGEMTLDAILTTDINMSGVAWDYPIGRWNPKVNDEQVTYRGHFDGQGHSIIGFDYTTAQNWHGFFGVISHGAIVENFSISGTVTNENWGTLGTVCFSRGGNSIIRNIRSSMNFISKKNGQTVGGILAEANTNGNEGATLIDHCIYSGTIDGQDTGTDGKYAGILGFVARTSAAQPTITNCLFDGELKNTSSSANVSAYGGICSFKNEGSITIKGCLSIGTLPELASGCGQILGKFVANGTNIFTNCYYKGAKISGMNPGSVSGTQVTDAQLASGEVCYGLNGDQSDIAWYQAIGTDVYPTLDATSGQVYEVGHFHCDGTPYDGASYSNENSGSITDEHDYPGGICSRCGVVDDSYNGVYKIGNVVQLKSFANLVNSKNNAADAILVDDIDMTGQSWTSPISDWTVNGINSAYKGHFDGQGHTISNLVYTTSKNFHSFFGVLTQGATVENFSINGSVTIGNHSFIGVVGYTRDGGITIRNIKSALNFTSTTSGKNVGGILGHADNGTTLIDRCTYSGTLDAQDTGTGGRYGGILGSVNSSTSNYPTITNCLFDGALTNTSSSPGESAYGGLVGFKGAEPTLNMENCLSIGTVPGLASGSGQIFGKANGAKTITPNCYYKGIKVTGQHFGDALVNEPVVVTDAQLASGEVCVGLGEAWYELLGTDGYPTLNNSKPNVYEFAVSSAGYATFVPKVNLLAIPEGVSAYAGQKSGEYLHLEPVTELPADNAVIVKAAEGVYYYNNTDETRTLGTSNDLTFSETAVSADGTQYCLANVGGVVGFYQVESGSEISARKAFLIVSSGVKAFCFEGDNATGISNLSVNDNLNNAIYNVAGQRLGKMQKGINIVNGKKVLR